MLLYEDRNTQLLIILIIEKKFYFCPSVQRQNKIKLLEEIALPLKTHTMIIIETKTRIDTYCSDSQNFV
jgi:hypothetical protein